MTTPIEMTAYRIMAETGLSARELAEMDISEYARITGRPTPAQAALAALQAQQQPPAQDATQTVPAEQPQAPQTPDFAAMSLQDYAAYRRDAGIGQGRQEGVGILSAPGQSWTEAARRQPGRSAWQGRQVTPAPQLTDRHVDRTARLDTRSAAERFRVPGNAYS